MNIDIKRLRVDAGYWAEVAPEWADIYGLTGAQFPVWANSTQYINVSGSQAHRIFSFESFYGFEQEEILTKAVRPGVQKPEWDGTGRPPVGAECEAVWFEAPDGGDRDFERVTIKGYWENQVWFCTVSYMDLVHHAANVDFRPIRTQAQREREELLTSIIEDYRTSFNSPVSTVELNLISEFANYLFEIGMLRSAGE